MRRGTVYTGTHGSSSAAGISKNAPRRYVRVKPMLLKRK